MNFLLSNTTMCSNCYNNPDDIVRCVHYCMFGPNFQEMLIAPKSRITRTAEFINVKFIPTDIKHNK